MMDPLLFGLEEESIVIEIGSLYTKCGYSGEVMPRAVVKNPSALTALNHQSPYNEYYRVLRDFLPLIYFHKVQARPKDAASVLVEKLEAPRQLIQAAADIMFNELQVPLIFFVLEPSLPIYCTGGYTGLVVDIGFSGTRLFPVRSMQIYEGIPIVQASVSLKCGLKQVAQRLEEELKEVNPQHEFDPVTVEDVMVRSLVVPSDQPVDRSHLAQQVITISPLASEAPVQFKLSSRLAAEAVMFASDTEANLAAGVLRCLRACAIDTRKVLADHLLVVGGGAMIPGMPARLQAEMLALLQGKEFRDLAGLREFVRVMPLDFPRNLVTWIGASIFGMMPNLKVYAVTKEDYDASGLVDKLGRAYLYPDPNEVEEPEVNRLGPRYRYSIV